MDNQSTTKPPSYREDMSLPDYDATVAYWAFETKPQSTCAVSSNQADHTAPPAQPAAAHTASQSIQQPQDSDSPNPDLEGQQTSSQSNKKKGSSICLFITGLISTAPAIVAVTLGVGLYDPPISQSYGATILWIYFWSWPGLTLLLMIGEKCSSLHFKMLCVPIVAGFITAMTSLGVYDPQEHGTA